MELLNFKKISTDLRVAMKGNTVTEKWPTQLNLWMGQEGSKEDFSLMLGAGFTNVERYIEWQRLQAISEAWWVDHILSEQKRTVGSLWNRDMLAHVKPIKERWW